MATAYIDFAELKQKLSIHQAAQFLSLAYSMKGESMRGPCPACKSGGERALVITPSKGLFYCFAAKQGGDCIKLVSHVRGCSQPEAAKLLNDHYRVIGGTVPVHSNSTGTVTVPPTAPQALTDQRSGFDPAAYAAKLDPLHASLVPLGISAVTLTEFRAGYASSGLLRGRLALPVHDLRGNMLWFCGRSLDNSEPRLVFPKNIDPQSVVFNGHAVFDTDFAYLCTDPLEVLKARENGIDNVVAALGSINPEFLHVLSLWMEEQRIAAIEPL